MCRNLGLVRADVSRLPFASGSVDAVHAGAAMHCWPSPSNAVSDLSFFCVFCGFGRHKPPDIPVQSGLEDPNSI
ncbi:METHYLTRANSFERASE-LIKE [Salix koriyanagi]|uniref:METHYLTRANSFERASE-LIKE n=1 Tax=Salix koriyanagi TaxID=2511006 RepID=A0A9Q1A5L3_9ROSI|nr:METHYLTRANSFERASE-LIKE [Salix koriyanagi]